MKLRVLWRLQVPPEGVGAGLGAHIPNYRIQQHHGCDRWTRKCVFLYLLQDFLALQCCVCKIQATPTPHTPVLMQNQSEK